MVELYSHTSPYGSVEDGLSKVRDRDSEMTCGRFTLQS